MIILKICDNIHFASGQTVVATPKEAYISQNVRIKKEIIMSADRRNYLIAAKIVEYADRLECLSPDEKHFFIKNPELAIEIMINGYRKFPKIKKDFEIWKTVLTNLILPKDTRGFVELCQMSGSEFRKGAWEIINSTSRLFGNFPKDGRSIDLCLCSTEDLLGRKATFPEIRDRVLAIGGAMCPAWLGVLLRKQWNNTAKDIRVNILMDPIEYLPNEKIFVLYNHEGKSFLDGGSVSELFTLSNEKKWFEYDKTIKWVFVLPNGKITIA